MTQDCDDEGTISRAVVNVKGLARPDPADAQPLSLSDAPERSGPPSVGYLGRFGYTRTD